MLSTDHEKYVNTTYQYPPVMSTACMKKYFVVKYYSASYGLNLNLIFTTLVYKVLNSNVGLLS